MFCVSQEAPIIDARDQLNLAKILKEDRAAKAKGKAKAKSKAKRKKDVDDGSEEEGQDTKSDDEVVNETAKVKAECKAAGQKSSRVEGDKEAKVESEGSVAQNSDKQDHEVVPPGGRRDKSARSSASSSASSGQGSSKRNRAQEFVRWDVNKFDRTLLVPYWSSGKTCGLKDKETNKQVISCSIFETIRENIYFLEDLAKKVDEGASIDEVVQEFESKKNEVRGRR